EPAVLFHLSYSFTSAFDFVFALPACSLAVFYYKSGGFHDAAFYPKRECRFYGIFLLFCFFSFTFLYCRFQRLWTSFFTYSRYFTGVIPTTFENRVTK